MNQDKALFLFEDIDDGEICLFIYKKLSPEALKIALPNTEIIEKANYFIAILKTGMDYLGATEFSGIERINQNENLVSLDLDYEEAKMLIKLTEEEFNKYYKFGSEKLEKLTEIEHKLL